MAAVPVETTVTGVQKDALRHQQLQQEQSGQLARQAAEVADLASIKRQLAESQVSPYTSLFLPPLSLQFIRRYYINQFHERCPWHDSFCSLASNMMQQSSTWCGTGSSLIVEAMSLIGSRQ